MKVAAAQNDESIPETFSDGALTNNNSRYEFKTENESAYPYLNASR